VYAYITAFLTNTYTTDAAFTAVIFNTNTNLHYHPNLHYQHHIYTSSPIAQACMVAKSSTNRKMPLL
jgi:hypothetical protein